MFNTLIAVRRIEEKFNIMYIKNYSLTKINVKCLLC